MVPKPLPANTPQANLNRASPPSANLPQDNPPQANPHQANPHQANPHQANPHQANPHQANPYQANPSQANPHQANPHQTNPSTIWDQNVPPTGPRAMMDSRNRQRQDGEQVKPKRNNKWVTNKEIREWAQKNSNEQVGAWGSNGSEAGFNSNPAADPDHDLKKLVDWEGNWLPGPTDWETRRGYHHHNFNEEMMRFVNGSIDTEAAVDIYNEPTFLNEPSGEVAPRIWASLRIEGTSLQEWWNNHVGSSLAEDDSKAWWREYTSEESSLLNSYDVPEARIDPTDHEGQILNVNDLGSGNASEKLMEGRLKKKADRERRRKREREELAAAIAEAPPVTFVEPAKIKPRISLYVRVALAADAQQIAGIYNHYVQNSIKSAEVVPLSVPDLARRIADETGSSMPWLVACQKGRKSGRGYTNGTDALILGFACASDYLSRQSMYAYTAEAEVFVHPNYHRHMIGSCLMDRLLYILDTCYDAKKGYQFTATGPFADHGGARVIGSVIMNVPFDKKDPEDLEGIAKFLGNFNFKKEAELPNIGVKKHMHVSLATFRYYTGTIINPKEAFF
ncbi:hypothetical protein SLS55_005100 [Diplodia seriata]|uniref:Acyl-n-acyltransferase n=1 Tax=Diplodia seriata TaxID=420778 RepID=A0ABR3CFF7_9PEZI